MDFSKTELMKKEFEDLIYVVIPSLNECGSFNVLKCGYCSNFSVTCNLCQDRRCKNCFKFNTSKEVLFEKCDKDTQEYLVNFLVDFFKIFDVTADFFNLSIKTRDVKNKNTFFYPKKKNKNYVKI